MSDLFQEEVPTAYIRTVVDIMLLAPWHTFQVLTKRAARMQALLSGELRDAGRAPHIWWGGSVEDKRYGVPASPIRRRHQLRYGFYPLSRCLKTYVLWTSMVFIGLLSGERVALGHVQCSKHG
jgi:hypothetical protein